MKKATSSSKMRRRLEGGSVGSARLSCSGDVQEKLWSVGARKEPLMRFWPLGKGL